MSFHIAPELNTIVPSRKLDFLAIRVRLLDSGLALGVAPLHEWTTWALRVVLVVRVVPDVNFEVVESVFLLRHGGWVLPSVNARDQQEAVLKERPCKVDGELHKVTRALQLVVRGPVAWLRRVRLIILIYCRGAVLVKS